MEKFNRIFLETLFLKSVITISQKVINRSSSNFAHFFYIIFSTAWTKDFFFLYSK